MLPAPVPDDRPRRRRRTARVLLIDHDDAVFLWHDSDPDADGRPGFWITAGGGVDAGESDRSAALREVVEETGVRLEPDDLIGPLAERTVVHGYSDLVVTQQEVFFAARVERRAPDRAGHTEDEQASIQGHRWWAVDELAATDQLVFPAGLAELARAAASALATRRTPAALVPLPAAQESTVDAGPPAEASVDAGHLEESGHEHTTHDHQMDATEWDRRYRDEGRLWGDQVTLAARPVLTALDAEHGGGRTAVDLACGSGRHALWLARHGWHVTAVDFSREAVAQGRLRSRAERTVVDWQVGDVLDWEPPEPVDLILIAFLHLQDDGLRAVLSRAIRRLTQTGSLLYVGHASVNIEHGTGGPQRPDVLPSAAYLATAVDGAELRGLAHVRRPVADRRDAIDIVLWASPWPAPELAPDGS